MFVFIGDLIDNAPSEKTDHITTLTKVRQLHEQGKALCVMGNHELNAIGWCLQKSDGTYCRSRTKASNIKQHQCFLQSVGNESQEHQLWIEWFKRLPIFLELDGVQAIHACWNEQAIAKIRPYLNEDNSLKTEYWYQAFDKQHELYHLLETLLKGPELTLPHGYSFQDKSGTTRHQIRVKWWKHDIKALTYSDIALVPEKAYRDLPQQVIPNSTQEMCSKVNMLTIVGHYTLPPTSLYQAIGDNVICVDYNAAKAQNPLVGYQYHTTTQQGRFIDSDNLN